MAPATLEHNRRHLRAFYRWSVKEGLLDRNPLSSVPVPRTIQKRPRYMSRAEVEAIRRHAPEWLSRVIKCNVLLGLRRGEVVSLRAADVDLHNGLVHVRSYEERRTKSGKDRSLPLPYDLIPDMTAKGEFVFTTTSGGRAYGPYVSRAFKKATRAAGLPEYNFHSLRHTACSWLAERGVPVTVIRDFAGHSSITVTERYMHLAPNRSHDIIRQAWS